MEFRRSIAKVLSNSNFHSIIRENDRSYINTKIDSYRRSNQISDDKNYLDILKDMYLSLSKNYRNEYIYKNTILNKIVLGRYSLRTTTLLNEFKIGKSIADTVILNGNAHVIEIKTELDTPQKLKKQINDYKKAFGHISVVLHESDLKAYTREIDPKIGIMALTIRNSLSIIREPKEDFSQLQSAVMHACLRKSEYSDIVSSAFGELPKVPNTLFYSECRRLLSKLDLIELHQEMAAQLKTRKLIASNYLESKDIPKELKHICYCLNFTQGEYDKLTTFLNEKP